MICLSLKQASSGVQIATMVCWREIAADAVKQMHPNLTPISSAS